MEQTYTLAEIFNTGLFLIMLYCSYVAMINVMQMVYMMLGFWRPRTSDDNFPAGVKLVFGIIIAAIMYFGLAEYLFNWVFSSN